MLLEPPAHFVVVNKLAAIRLRDTFTHRRAEPGGSLEKAEGGVLHQLLGIRTGMIGDLGELGFLLGRETDFHAASLAI